MFRRNKGTDVPSGEIGLLGVDTHFKGAIRFSGTLRIDGKVEGNVTSAPGSGSVLVVHQQAIVQGDIVSDSVLISGEVEGTVRAQDRVEIYESGMLKGDIYTKDILIEGGAGFEGYCHMQNGSNASDAARGAKQNDKPASASAPVEDAPAKRRPSAAEPPTGGGSGEPATS